LQGKRVECPFSVRNRRSFQGPEGEDRETEIARGIRGGWLKQKESRNGVGGQEGSPRNLTSDNGIQKKLVRMATGKGNEYKKGKRGGSNSGSSKLIWVKREKEED